MFRNNFVWGVASSAYQVEGCDTEVKGGLSVWDTFTEAGNIFEHQNAYVSCDHIHHYKEDYALMREMGIKAYRFSLNWCKIIPNGIGEVNIKAVELYRNMIQEMKNQGIEPYLTLFHWEYPQVLENKGGWLHPDSSEWFGEYAKVVAENFSDLCHIFITMNEPQCVVGLGYMTGKHAPGKKVSIDESFQITHNILKAHGKAVIALRKYAKQEIQVGFAPTCGVAIPATESAEDIEAARRVYLGCKEDASDWSWTVSWFSDPILLGRYPDDGLKLYQKYLPEITDADMELIHQPLDFYAQNIYNGYLIRAGENGEPEYVSRKVGAPKTACGWPVTPEALYWGMRFLYERYKMPILITENGMSCHDMVSSDGKVHDPNRITFLEQYLKSVERALEEGIDVIGYFEWTFLDNFEWTEGYNERFGLVYVDFETQKRIPKDSCYWYKNIIESHGAFLQ